MIKRFQEMLRRKGIDAAVFISMSQNRQDPNILCLSGINVDCGMLAVPAKGNPLLLIPGFDYKRIKKLSHMKVVKARKESLFAPIKRMLRRKRVVGINKAMVSLKEYSMLRKGLKNCRFRDIAALCTESRSIKDGNEIITIKRACSITCRILSACIGRLSRDMTELQAAKQLEYEARKAGCELAFPPIVASGRNASFPHHQPEDTKLKKGFCIIDFGVKYKGYCSDVSRTVYIGKPSEKDKAAYNNVLKVQEECISKCVPGAKASEIYSIAFRHLGKEFIHNLGHGIGVEIHELPNLSHDSNYSIKECMVLTVEPGIYSKRRGIRIEDDILIRKKPETLTKAEKSLIII